MSAAVTFAVQNWIITPEALALGEAPPATIGAQKFILQLTGVANVDLQGTLPNDWTRQTVSLQPNLAPPLNWAIAKWGIPTPWSNPINRNRQYSTIFSLEQWAPFAAVSSTVYDGSGPTAVGFAVDQWRLTQFGEVVDVNNQPITNAFNGIDVDLAVLDTKGLLYRVSYNITLVGRIDFYLDQTIM